MNKRGGFLDWFMIIAVLMAFAISIIVGAIILAKVDASGIFADNTDAQTSLDHAKSTLFSMDNMFLFVIVGLSIFVLVSSAVVFNHPAFFIISTVLLFIAVIVAAIASNTMWIFFNQDMIATTAVQFPKMTFLMERLPFYVIFMGMAASIAAYVSWKKA